jgi:hypothetical protein
VEFYINFFDKLKIKSNLFFGFLGLARKLNELKKYGSFDHQYLSIFDEIHFTKNYKVWFFEVKE